MMMMMMMNPWVNQTHDLLDIVDLLTDGLLQTQAYTAKAQMWCRCPQG